MSHRMSSRPSSRPCPRPIGAALAGAALLVASTVASAEAQLLDDHEMRAVYGRADPTLTLPGLAGGGASNGGDSKSNDPGTVIANDLLKGAVSAMLDRQQFLAAWSAAAGPDSTPPGYDGREVTQLVLNATPVTVSFEASRFLTSLAGGGTLQGPSMGVVTFDAIDARGTTLWVWGH
jgi:hypothetical protein